MLIVVQGVGDEDVVEVATPEDREWVKTFPADASDPALGVRSCFRRPYRRFDDTDAFGAENLVEVTGELAVAITDKKQRADSLVVERISRLRACCVTQPPFGLVVIPARCTRRVASSMKNKT